MTTAFTTATALASKAFSTSFSVFALLKDLPDSHKALNRRPRFSIPSSKTQYGSGLNVSISTCRWTTQFIPYQSMNIKSQVSLIFDSLNLIIYTNLQIPLSESDKVHTKAPKNPNLRIAPERILFGTLKKRLPPSDQVLVLHQQLMPGFCRVSL